MEAKAYQRRATGEMAIDPALRQLVLHTGALLDRLICARGLAHPGGAAGTGDAAGAPPPQPRRGPETLTVRPPAGETMPSLPGWPS